MGAEASVDAIPGARLVPPEEGVANLLLLELARGRYRQALVTRRSGDPIEVRDLEHEEAIDLDSLIRRAGDDYHIALKQKAGGVFDALRNLCGATHARVSVPSVKHVRVGLQHILIQSTWVASPDRQELRLHLDYCGSHWSCRLLGMKVRIREWLSRPGANRGS